MHPPAPPEQEARRQIDAMLLAAGWAVQSRRALNLAAAPGVAVREFRTTAGPADYLLFLGNQLAGVIEAKKAGSHLSGIEAQTRDYAENAPANLQVPLRPLPFLYESTGIETWFTNGLDPDPRGHRVFSFHRPETLRHWITRALDHRDGRPGAPPAPTVKGRMRLAPPLNPAGLWPAQIRAVERLEDSFRQGRPRALIQMATGAGKTYTAITAIYRLLTQGGARRVLFLVDRGNLGRQALNEFQGFVTPDDGRKLTELHNVVNLTHNTVNDSTRVVITTIQRLYSILQGEDTFDDELEEGSAFTGHGAALVREPPPVVYNEALPPDFFDVIVIDECHRSIYSLWRQVLEYFDATLIGLTATPDARTYAFFHQNVVSEYTHLQAVGDRVNVQFDVYEIRTRITESGATLIAEPGVFVGKRSRQTRAERWQALDEDLTYEAPQLDRSVVVPDQIRTIIRTLRQCMFTEIFPGRTELPKTLIFAKSDDHAEDILRILREEWPLSNQQAVKITYRAERPEDGKPRKSASHKPDELIKAFRGSYNPRVAVTVDMIATGTDIKPLECVVFMRTVKSHGLFEQMKGRGVRVIPDTDFQTVTRDARRKTRYVIVDCVGVMEQKKSQPPLDRDRGISFEKLLELVRAGNRDEDILATLAARLDRMDRRLDPAQQARIEATTGGVSLRSLITGIIDRLDADAEDERARAIYALPADAQSTDARPTDAQRAAAGAMLREEAAAPIAYDPDLCDTLLEVRKAQEVTLDFITPDKLLRAGPRADLKPDYAAAQALISEFTAFCHNHRDRLDALAVLYARPYQRRLTRAQLTELLAAIEHPPRQWTTAALWAAYERLERDRVRGASSGRQLTDLISLVRHAMGVDSELVSYADQAAARFETWLAQQANRGRTFSDEQRGWLALIRDRIVVDLEVRLDDFDQTPFIERGGLGKVWSLFGDDLHGIVEELNRELVA